MTEEKKEEEVCSNVNKKVDESWKESVERDKRRGSAEPGQPSSAETGRPAESKKIPPLPEPDFSMFVSGMGMQVLMHLGEMENPFTQKKEKDLKQAKYIIDILGILQEKTKGNLSVRESALLEGLLYDLRMKYVSASK